MRALKRSVTIVSGISYVNTAHVEIRPVQRHPAHVGLPSVLQSSDYDKKLDLQVHSHRWVVDI